MDIQDRIILLKSVPTENPPAGYVYQYVDPADNQLKHRHDDGSIDIYSSVEEGGNADGEWVKYSNGIMKCWLQTGSVSHNTTIPFPQSFIDTNYRMAFSYNDGAYFPSWRSLTTSSFNLGARKASDPSTVGTARNTFVIVIGRWK